MSVDANDGGTLEQRLRLIEDYTASVWTEDGVFDRGAEFPRPTGRAAIAGGSGNPE